MVSMDTMDMDMAMARGLLMLDMAMVLLFTAMEAIVILIEAHRDSMDTMVDMDTKDMVVLVTSKLTDHTLTMGSVLLILTKSGVRWRLCNSCNVKCQDTDMTHNNKQNT